MNGGFMVDINKKLTKAQLVNEFAEKSVLSKREIQTVLDELVNILKRELGSRGPGEFVLPGVVKFKVRTIAARRERKGIDPFTGEERIFKSKPASKRIRVSALKKLKDLVK